MGIKYFSIGVVVFTEGDLFNHLTFHSVFSSEKEIDQQPIKSLNLDESQFDLTPSNKSYLENYTQQKHIPRSKSTYKGQPSPSPPPKIPPHLVVVVVVVVEVVGEEVNSVVVESFSPKSISQRLTKSP